MLWLNIKHIEVGLDHKNVQEITLNYYLNCGKHRYELVNEPKKVFIDQNYQSK